MLLDVHNKLLLLKFIFSLSLPLLKLIINEKNITVIAAGYADIGRSAVQGTKRQASSLAGCDGKQKHARKHVDSSPVRPL